MKKINWDKVYEITENKLNLQIKESSDLEFVNKDGETEKSLTRTKITVVYISRDNGVKYLKVEVKFLHDGNCKIIITGEQYSPKIIEEIDVKEDEIR